MNILILTKNLDGFSMDEYLRSRGYFPVLCPDLESVIDFSVTEGIGMLICDFKYFGRDSRNPYKTLSEKLFPQKIPFVFFNDPFVDPGSDDCLAQWVDTVMEYYGEVTEEIRSLLTELMVAVMVDNVSGSENFGTEKKLFHGDNFSDAFEKINSKLCIPNGKLKLLKLFYRKRGKAVKVDELCNDLWNECNQRSRANLYSYISYLRKIFKNFPGLEMSITSNRKGWYVFNINTQAMANL